MVPSYISTLQLQDFRSFAQATFSFDQKQTLILGDNGKGKTNILESLSLLSTGKSFRGRSLSECVRMGTDVAHIGIRAGVDGEEDRQVGGQSADCTENPLEGLGVIHVRGPVQSQNSVRPTARAISAKPQFFY